MKPDRGRSRYSRRSLQMRIQAPSRPYDDISLPSSTFVTPLDVPLSNGNLDKPEPDGEGHKDNGRLTDLRDSYLFLRVRSAVPGCALKLSAAPPTTIVIADPPPCPRMFWQDSLLTEQTPIHIKISR